MSAAAPSAGRKEPGHTGLPLKERVCDFQRLFRHARARTPNDLRVREGDYFVGSRAPQTGTKEEHVAALNGLFSNPPRGDI